jgi:hypothetical protein
VRAVRAPWTSASFLLYAGALLAVIASGFWLGIISGDHSAGAFAGWATVFWAVAEGIALGLLVRGRRLAAGLAAFVGLVFWAVMVGAFFSWWGWLANKGSPFSGFHVGDLALELLVLLAALVDLRIWRHPLLVAIAAPTSWFFATDFVSNGGNWSAAFTLLYGFFLFFVGLALEGDRRPYGFWVHVTAGLTIGGAFLYWWHSSDAEWAGNIIVALVFILVAAAIRRSSYAVLGALGLAAATGYYSIPQMLPGPLYSNHANPTPWAGPVAYLCLGVFLALLGMLLYRRRSADAA